MNLALVDSGDQTDDVYDFYLFHSDWALPCKGVPAMQSHYASLHVHPGMVVELNQGDEAQVIDPKNTATDAAGFLKTQQGLISSGQKTFPELCAEYGKDWKEAIDEMAEVARYAKEKGIDIGGMLFGTGTAGGPPGREPFPRRWP